MRRLAPTLVPLLLLLPACSSSSTEPDAPSCYPAFEPGAAAGHPEPLGARAAGQARAGRIDDLSVVPQPAHDRQRIETGDYLLANDRMAVVVAQPGLGDGYQRGGGDLLSLDRLGDDGQPLGASMHVETGVIVGGHVLRAASVGVLSDGSDGGPAVVRAVGKLVPLDYLGAIADIFNQPYDFDTAVDYVLEPGSDALHLRLHLANASATRHDLGVEYASDMMLGLFHYAHNEQATPEFGFAEPVGAISWVGYDGGADAFAMRAPGHTIEHALTEQGFALFGLPGFYVEACGVTTVDVLEVLVGGPEYDGLRVAVARHDGEPAWRAITGVVRDGAGAAVPGAWVHALDEDAAGAYLSRVHAGPDGSYTIHAPPGRRVRLVPQLHGYPQATGTVVEAASAAQDLAFAPHGLVTVHATDAGTADPLPVRVQVVPVAPEPPTPEAFGVEDERDGRLHQAFAMSGDVTLPVPPGQHRIVVSHGYEWELVDTTVDVAAGANEVVDAPLEHSVDSQGYLCGDFHIHTYQSPDSNDSPEHKVRASVADGLEIACSSEHEWVVDFGPVVAALGLEAWAYGMASEELTTFRYGHFGIVPLTVDPEAYHHGAVDWVGLSPGEAFAAAHARPEAPAIIVNHPRAPGIGGYFNALGFDRATVTGKLAGYSPDFDALEVFNSTDVAGTGEMLDDWFALLGSGRRIFALGNSDSHHIRSSPTGYPRTCFDLGHDDPQALTPSGVRDAILAGHSTVSGGLFLTVAGPGGEGPGDVVANAGGPLVFTVTVQAPSFITGDSLETFVDGASVAVEPLLPIGSGPGQRWVNLVSLDLAPGPHFVVFHAKGAGSLAPLHPGKRPFGMSNPVFVE
ncbi:MAG: CehA/McbA family metallohydrolase [Polyangiaceae bacterium]|nr:CehA/McbA family metallohydrolase [Polyangiaceae bacterium]